MKKWIGQSLHFHRLLLKSRKLDVLIELLSFEHFESLKISRWNYINFDFICFNIFQLHGISLLYLLYLASFLCPFLHDFLPPISDLTPNISLQFASLVSTSKSTISSFPHTGTVKQASLYLDLFGASQFVGLQIGLKSFSSSDSTYCWLSEHGPWRYSW